MKKVILSIFFLLMILPTLVCASVGSLVKVGNKYYDSFTDAIANSSANDTIMLISDVKLEDTIVIDKPININLNGNDISANEKVFLVDGGTLNITGTGIIKENNPNYSAIYIKGSTNSQDNEYSVVNVGPNVTLEGWSGIFITPTNSKAYGVKVNLSGTINAKTDSSGSLGAGIYVNGQIKDKLNSPTINIKNGAKITSTGTGLYIAGYGTYNINKASISGKISGIGIKSGILNIDGATVSSNGPDTTPTEGFNNGIRSSGTTFQIESNDNYAGDIEINIDSGTFTSTNSNVIYEYIGKGGSSQVIALSISGGTFISEASKPVIQITDSLKQYHNNFISGGKYSSDIDEYLKTGYESTKENNLYIVTESVMKGVFSYDTKNSSNVGIILLTIVSIILVSYIIYKNKFSIKKIR